MPPENPADESEIILVEPEPLDDTINLGRSRTPMPIRRAADAFLYEGKIDRKIPSLETLADEIVAAGHWIEPLERFGLKLSQTLTVVETRTLRTILKKKLRQKISELKDSENPEEKSGMKEMERFLNYGVETHLTELEERAKHNNKAYGLMVTLATGTVGLAISAVLLAGNLKMGKEVVDLGDRTVDVLQDQAGDIENQAQRIEDLADSTKPITDLADRVGNALEDGDYKRLETHTDIFIKEALPDDILIYGFPEAKIPALKENLDKQIRPNPVPKATGIYAAIAVDRGFMTAPPKRTLGQPISDDFVKTFKQWLGSVDQGELKSIAETRTSTDADWKNYIAAFGRGYTEGQALAARIRQNDDLTPEPFIDIQKPKWWDNMFGRKE